MKKRRKNNIGFDAFGSMMICELKSYRIHRHTLNRFECSIYCIILSNWTSIVLLMNTHKFSKKCRNSIINWPMKSYTYIHIIINSDANEAKRSQFSWTSTVQYLFVGIHICMVWCCKPFELLGTNEAYFSLDKHSSDWTSLLKI